ncbi:MAG: hypothetical protein ACWA40_10815 [Planktomarina sp.]
MYSRFLSSSLLTAIAAVTLSACGAAVTTPTSNAPTAAAVVGVPVALQTSGQDSCGAVDYKFLEGQPFASTFDLRLPANTRYLGRRQAANAENASRLSFVVSTASPSMAAYTEDSKILKVFCG